MEKTKPQQQFVITEDQLKEIAYIAWKGAQNAYQLYPDNKHTFSGYWDGAKDQFDKYRQPVDKTIPSHP